MDRKTGILAVLLGAGAAVLAVLVAKAKPALSLNLVVPSSIIQGTGYYAETTVVNNLSTWFEGNIRFSGTVGGAPFVFDVNPFPLALSPGQVVKSTWLFTAPVGTAGNSGTITAQLEKYSGEVLVRVTSQQINVTT